MFLIPQHICGSSVSSRRKAQNCQTAQSIVQKQPCVSTTREKSKGMRSREVLGAVVITTLEACFIFSFFKKKKNGNRLTSFLTALFIAVVRAVILAIAPPWQTNAAPVPTTELVSCAHWSGCRVHRRALFIQICILKSSELISSCCFSANKLYMRARISDTKQILHPTGLLSAERSSYSLQFFSSDWSSQSNSPSHLQPALMHMPLLHMNSTALQGWWDAAHTEQHRKRVAAGKNLAAVQAGPWVLSVFAGLGGLLDESTVLLWRRILSQARVYFCPGW